MKNRLLACLLTVLLLCAPAVSASAEGLEPIGENEVISGAAEAFVPEAEEFAIGGDGGASPAAEAVAVSGASDPDFEIDENGVLTKYVGAGGDVEVPDGVTAIGFQAFYDNMNVTSVTLPDSVTRIEQDGFLGCGLKSIRFSRKLEFIGECAFTASGLEKVELTDSVTEIEMYAFHNTPSLKYVRLSANLKTIGSSVFSYCDITEITIPNGVQCIGTEMFKSNENLTEVTLPASVTNVGSGAFAKCTSLSKVTILGSGIEGPENAFDDCSSGLKFYLAGIDMETTQWPLDAGLVADDHDHVPVTIPAVAPTYTKTGLTEGKKCSICGEILQAQETVAKLTVPEGSLLVTKDRSKKMKLLDSFRIVLNGEKATAYASSNETVVKVSSKGLVKALKEGSATVTVTTKAGKEYKLTLTVTDAAKLSQKTLALKLGGSKTLTVKNAANRKVTWKSSKPKIATVSSKGVVKALKVGECTITATVKNGKKLKCSVTVTDGVKLSTTRLSLNLGDKQTLKVNNAAGRKATWTSSKPKIATVSSKGVVKGLKTGNCTITATLTDGKTLKCSVAVVDGAAISAERFTLAKGGTGTLTISGLAGRSVKWTSSAPTVVSVKGDKGTATITALKEGKATIKAAITGGDTLECVVEVGTPVTVVSAEVKTGSTGYYDDLNVVFRNDSDKTVKEIKVEIFDPKQQFVSYTYNCNIAPGGSGTAKFWVSKGMSSTVPEILEVGFADGTRWMP